MDEFNKSDELLTKMKADVGNRIFPDLLHTVAEAVHVRLMEAVRVQSEKSSDQNAPKMLSPNESKFPPKVIVTLVGQGTAIQVDGYKKAFQTVYELNLQEKSKFLKLLREVGVK